MGFAKNVIIHRHLKSGMQHAPDCPDGVVLFVVLLKFDQEQLCVQSFDLGNLLPVKWLLSHKVLHKFVIRQGIQVIANLLFQFP